MIFIRVFNAAGLMGRLNLLPADSNIFLDHGFQPDETRELLKVPHLEIQKRYLA